MDKIALPDDAKKIRRVYAKRKALLRSRGFVDYETYKRSDWHARIRAYVMLRDDRRCRMCSGEGTEAHHIVYDADSLFSRPGNPKDNPDLLPWVVTMCRKCHAAQHMRPDGSFYPNLEYRALLTMGIAPKDPRVWNMYDLWGEYED